jgi:hypothetical protein
LPTLIGEGEEGGGAGGGVRQQSFLKRRLWEISLSLHVPASSSSSSTLSFLFNRAMKGLPPPPFPPCHHAVAVAAVATANTISKLSCRLENKREKQLVQIKIVIFKKMLSSYGKNSW